MINLLHISASPRGAASRSIALAGEFIAAYRRTRPESAITEWDLWDGTLPDFGPHAAHAKMATLAGEPLTGEQQTAYQRAIDTFQRFDAADRYLFSVPMWNATIPYILKQLIDVISQPGLASAGVRHGLPEPLPGELAALGRHRGHRRDPAPRHDSRAGSCRGVAGYARRDRRRRPRALRGMIMSLNWLAVIAAGLLEIGWAHSIRATDGFTKLVPTLVCGALTLAVLVMLDFGMRGLPVGTAYAVFVGIGATGTALVGMIWRAEPVSLLRVTALVLIIGGVVLLNVADRILGDHA